MNILFISHLSHTNSSGTVWSVPARIKAQSLYDNVLWINLLDAEHLHWKKVKGYTNYKSYQKISLDYFQKPFDRPDFVVFEGFYGGIHEARLAIECRKKSIKYIIVPRGSLTRNARNNHSRFKKNIAHFLFYDSFVNKSAAVQYLTDKEYQDSKYRFNVNHFIIPNGTKLQPIVKESFSTNKINAVYIARVDIYHKGLDLLLEACKIRSKELLEANFKLTVYGPRLKDYYKFDKLVVDYNLQKIISLGGEVSGKVKQNAILNSDLFVLTSRFEGHPMGLIEALSYGVPCLITEGTNISKEVEDNHCGFVSPTSVEGIVSSLDKLLSNNYNLSELGCNAIKLANNYNWDKFALDFHNKLRNLK